MKTLLLLLAISLQSQVDSLCNLAYDAEKAVEIDRAIGSL